MSTDTSSVISDFGIALGAGVADRTRITLAAITVMPAGATHALTGWLLDHLTTVS